MANDTDEEGDDLKAFKFIDPLYGIATISEDGKIEYIHDDSETTFDSLRYIVKDSICGDTATVYITINPVPDCPIVEDDVYLSLIHISEPTRLLSIGFGGVGV